MGKPIFVTFKEPLESYYQEYFENSGISNNADCIRHIIAEYLKSKGIMPKTERIKGVVSN